MTLSQTVNPRLGPLRYENDDLDVQAPVRALVKLCAHERHVGTCAECQRYQLSRWSSQLSEVSH